MHIKYQGEITIEQVLSDMRSVPGRVFWLAFVRGTGKERGSVKVVSRCRYGSPQSAAGSPQSELGLDELLGDRRKKWLHVDKGTLPLTDHDSGQYLTPLISHLIGFNLKRIIH
jgi:hypothetical protein